jgi:hypothetical protein
MTTVSLLQAPVPLKHNYRNVSGCNVHLSDVSADSPLILQHTFRNGISPFRMPSDQGSDSLTISSGDAVRLACPDADNNLLVIPNSPLMVYEVIAFCIRGKTYSCIIIQGIFSDISASYVRRYFLLGYSK